MAVLDVGDYYILLLVQLGWLFEGGYDLRCHENLGKYGRLN